MTLTEVLAALESLSLADVVQVHQTAWGHVQRLSAIETAQDRVDEIVAEYQEAIGRADGDPWVQPVSAVDAYRLGAVVTRDGATWVSKIGSNVTMPGDPSDPQNSRWWQKLADPDAGPEEWDPLKSYDAGATVAHVGKLWTAKVFASPGWEPGDPALWAVWAEVAP